MYYLGFISPIGRDNFEGEGVDHFKVSQVSAVNYAEMAEQIEMLYGIWTLVGPRNYVLGGMQTGATW